MTMTDRSDTALSSNDRLAIADLLARYCHATDERDFVALAAMLTPDHVGDLGPAGVHSGRDAVLAATAGILSRIEVTQHQVTTIALTQRPAGASAKTNFTARHVQDGGHFTVGGVYHDQFVSVKGHWMISARRIVVTWTEGDPAVLGI
jgi:hypothetical protein